MKQSEISEIMKKSVEYYKYIDIEGERLAKECMKQIQPLLDSNEFREAKKQVKKFFKPSEIDGDTVFIDYAIIISSINRKIANSKLNK